MEQLIRKQLPTVNRPQSQCEHIDIRAKHMERLNVGSVMVYHQRCNHFYLAKNGGKKEAAVQSGEPLDDGCCSVCWKLRKSTNEIRDEVEDMVEAYHMNFENKPERWSPLLIHLEHTYYKWLYIDFERKNRNRENRGRGGDNNRGGRGGGRGGNNDNRGGGRGGNNDNRGGRGEQNTSIGEQNTTE